MSSNTNIEEAVVAAFRQIVRDTDSMRQIALAELQWLTIDDISKLTGYGTTTIEKWRDEGWIRMFQPGDSRTWRTTLQMWREDERILIEAGLLDERGQRRSIDERKQRISELKRRRLRVVPKRSQAA